MGLGEMCALLHADKVGDVAMAILHSGLRLHLGMDSP